MTSYQKSGLGLAFNDAVLIPLSGRKVKQQDYASTRLLPIVDQGQKIVAGYTDDLTRRVNCELPVIVFGDHTKALKFIDFEFAAGADGIKVIKPVEAFDPDSFFTT